MAADLLYKCVLGLCLIISRAAKYLPKPALNNIPSLCAYYDLYGYTALDNSVRRCLVLMRVQSFHIGTEGQKYLDIEVAESFEHAALKAVVRLGQDGLDDLRSCSRSKLSGRGNQNQNHKNVFHF